MNRRLMDQQQTETAERNAENLSIWHRKCFGPVVGAILDAETAEQRRAHHARVRAIWNGETE